MAMWPYIDLLNLLCGSFSNCRNLMLLFTALSQNMVHENAFCIMHEFVLSWHEFVIDCLAQFSVSMREINLNSWELSGFLRQGTCILTDLSYFQNYDLYLNKPTRQLPMGAGHCPWSRYTDRIVCDIHGEVQTHLNYRQVDKIGL